MLSQARSVARATRSLSRFTGVRTPSTVTPVAAWALAPLSRAYKTSAPVGAAPPPPAPTPLARMSDSFNDGANAAYLEELERQYAKDPSSVPRSWANYLNALGAWIFSARILTIRAISLLIYTSSIRVYDLQCTSSPTKLSQDTWIMQITA
eukprot:5398370-Pyramimonas_sp.AAC.2